MIDGVIFDKDGTLFDFRLSWGAWAGRLMATLGRDADHARALGRAIGYDADSGDFAATSPVIAGTAEEIAAALVPQMPGLSQHALMDRINALAEGAPMAEAVPLVPFLGNLRARGLRLGLATNDTEGPARAHLAAHGITDFFDFIAGYDSGYGAKPGPGMCLAFSAQTGIAPARVVMVGDSLHDLAAGRAAGMRTVAVLTGVAGSAELAPHAEAVLAHVGHLPAWLDATGSA